MKVAYITSYNALDIRNWSGTALHMARALEKQSVDVHYVGPLVKTHRLLVKAKQCTYRVLGKNYLHDRSPLRLKGYAAQISKELKTIKPDIVFSPGSTEIAYLDCKEPIVFWTDATFARMVDFYESFSNLPLESLRDGQKQEESALQHCKLAIYSSEWARNSAIEQYRIDPQKVKVIPFGANLTCDRATEQLTKLIGSKTPSPCSLLFLGVDWIRKGGPLALEVAEDLNKKGWKTDLNIVGCSPPASEKLPGFAKVFGFISKSTEEGKRQLHGLLEKSHFLILPSIAECTPIAFCEANSFALPCLSTDIGGIPSVITNGVNGKSFPLNATASDYSAFIISLLSDFDRYREVARSSRAEYESRLNWTTAGETLKKFLSELL